MKTLDEIAAQVKEAFGGKPGKLHPCAFFDDRLDCIRVIARDCSVLETQVNQCITVLEDGYYADSGGSRYVGFAITGARHFCREHNLDFSAPIKTSTLLDAILASFPEVAVELFVNAIARPLVEEKKIKQVEVSGALPQPQPA